VDGAYVGRLLDWAADRPLVFKVDLDATIGFAAGLRVTPAEILGGTIWLFPLTASIAEPAVRRSQLGSRSSGT
jgi:hypothetical protein